MGDVAELAGVSQQTVSRVVNSHEYVGGHTRERVLAAMRELNYRPNLAAQALVTGRSKTLGVVSIESVAFGPSSVLLGLERAAHARGFFVSVARLASLDRGSLFQALEQLQRQSVEGILLNAGQDGITDELDRRLIDVPVVAVEDTPEASGADRRGRPGGGRGGGHAAAARARPSEGRARRRAEGLVVGAQADGGLARGAGVGRASRWRRRCSATGACGRAMSSDAGWPRTAR